jgi:hypothetical protein
MSLLRTTIDSHIVQNNAAFCGKNMRDAIILAHGPHADGHDFGMMGGQGGPNTG